MLPDVVPLSAARRRIVVAAVMTGMFLSALETTVVGTAMPTVVASLGGLAYYSWVFTAYLLASTVTGPIWGKLSDSHGRRRVFTWGTLIFLIGSALAGQSRTMLQLIVFRALQGLGAGALMPICQTILADIYTLEDRARMQGWISSVWGIASLAGPLVGGFLTDSLSWRWVFYVNLPFGAAALAAMAAFQEPATHRQRTPLDIAGAATLSAGVLALLTALSAGGREWALTSPISVGLFSTAALLLALFVWLESRAREPIIAPALFAHRIFVAATLGGVFAGMALYIAITFLPLFVQAVIGTSATRAGVVMTPMMITWVLCNVPVGRLMISQGYRALMIAGSLLLVCGFLTMTSLGAGSAWGTAGLSMVLCGAGLSCSFMPMTVAVQSAVPRHQRGMATSTVQFFRTIGGALGVALLGALLASSFEARLEQLSREGLQGLTREQVQELAHRPGLIVDPKARQTLPAAAVPAIAGALAQSLHLVFLGGVAVALCVLFTSLLVPRGRAGDLQLKAAPE